MKPFKSILLVTPHKQPDSFLHKAAELASTSRAQVTLVDVVSDKAGYVSRNALGITSDEIWSAVLEGRKERLDKLKPQFGRTRAHTMVLLGPAHVEIIREVLRHHHDLVMVEENAHSQHLVRLLLRKCPSPVWVVPQGNHKPGKRILAAVDPESQDHRKQELNAEVLDAAAMIAKAFGMELHVVHAWTLFGESALRSAFGVPENDLNRALKEAHKERVSELNRLLSPARIRNLKPKVHLIKGEADEVIPALTNRKGFNLLVMGTVCRTGLAGFFMGNTAELILDGVACPVLALKPSGFVSPVTLPENETAGDESEGFRKKAARA